MSAHRVDASASKMPQEQRGGHASIRISQSRDQPRVFHRKDCSPMFCKPTIAKQINVPTILAVALCLSACAGADYKPVVDMRGHSEAAYDRDVALCQQTARGARDNTNIAEDAGL